MLYIQLVVYALIVLSIPKLRKILQTLYRYWVNGQEINLEKSSYMSVNSMFVRVSVGMFGKGIHAVSGGRSERTCF